MGRAARAFTAEQLKEMHRLFDMGESTEYIGKLYDASAQVIGRALRPRLGDLRQARARVTMKLNAGRASTIQMDYREGFEAGVRQALTWVHLHGLEAVRAFDNEVLLSWREHGRPDLNGNLAVPVFRK